ncbi:MAG TPA: 30S ribosomal protein S3 [Acidobacteriota bacterium]|nr:30S ribosomal protein S3 [Acidobacteriota bacterium]
MIERKVVNEKLQEYLVEQFIGESLSRVGYSHTQVQKTPVGEKIVIHASRPGLIVGSKGSNIKKLTKVLKTKFKFDNPQIEIAEVTNSTTNAQLIAENIAFQLEKFGPQRFKGIGYAAMENAMKGGVLGIEILISGKLPSARAKSWRFYLGYLKKCGDIAISGVDKAYTQAKLKAGVIGVQVSILPASTVLPDRIQIFSEMQDVTPHAKDTGSKIEVAPEADAASNPVPVDLKVEAPKANANAPAAPANIKDMAKEKKARKPRAKKAEGAEAPAKTE